MWMPTYLEVRVNAITIVVHSMLMVIYAVVQLMVNIAFCLLHFISSSLLGQCNCTNGELTCICELNTYINKLYTGDACECTEANCYDQSIPYDSSRQVDDRLPARSYVFNFLYLSF